MYLNWGASTWALVSGWPQHRSQITVCSWSEESFSSHSLVFTRDTRNGTEQEELRPDPPVQYLSNRSQLQTSGQSQVKRSPLRRHWLFSIPYCSTLYTVPHLFIVTNNTYTVLQPTHSMKSELCLHRQRLGCTAVILHTSNLSYIKRLLSCYTSIWRDILRVTPFQVSITDLLESALTASPNGWIVER